MAVDNYLFYSQFLGRINTEVSDRISNRIINLISFDM